MADKEQLKILDNGVDHWNQWRKENPKIVPNLTEANLSGTNLIEVNLTNTNLFRANLSGANLSKANLSGTILKKANLSGTILKKANLTNADFTKADIRRSNLTEANLNGANLIEAHLIDAHLKEADLSKANLIGAYLSGANLHMADLREASLIEAGLSGVNLNGANLSGAELNGANLSEARLIGANLSGAVLSGANFSSANLWEATFCTSYTPAAGDTDSRSKQERKREAQPIRVSGASFIGANLTGANWTDADLTETKLQNTILKNADLTGVTSLLAEQLAGADITNAKLPANLDEEFEKPLAVIEKAAGYARKIYLAMLLGCAYSLLTIFTTDDVDLVTNSASSKLPIIGATVPIAGYYLLAPLVLIGFYVYFHISMQRIWENAARLPAVFPDGRSLDRVVDPWLLTGLLRAHLYRLRPNIEGDSRRAKLMSWFKAEKAYLGSLQNGFSILLAWCAVPFTVGWMGYAYLTAHDLWPTLIHCFLIAITTTFGLWSYSLARGTLRGTLVQSRLSYFNYRAFTGVMVALIIFCVTSVFGLWATGLTCSLSDKLRWELIDCSGTYPQRPWIVAELVEKQISKKPANYYELKIAVETLKLKRDIEKPDSLTPVVSFERVQSVLIEAIEGADLRNRNLRGANARLGFFVRADLREAILIGADLHGADFSGANLNESKLNWVNLNEAKLSKASLVTASLRNAALFAADLSGANLRRSDLVEADLVMANLSGAILAGAKLSGAILAGAKYLTCAQIQSARIDKNTQLPDYIKIAWAPDDTYKCEEIKKEEKKK